VDILGTLWNLAPLWAGLIVFIVVAALIMRTWRARTAQVAARNLEPAPPPPEPDPEELDSSHIGFAPLVRSILRPAPPKSGPERSQE
jgi:hypothetical protein